MMIINKSNVTDATSRAGISYPLEAHEFIPVFYRGSCCSVLRFLSNVLQIILYLLAIVLSPSSIYGLFCLLFWYIKTFFLALASSGQSYFIYFYRDDHI